MEERLSEQQIEEIRNQALEKAKKAQHAWRQRGGWIMCTSCDFEHGIRITPNKRMTGISKEGMPILEDRK